MSYVADNLPLPYDFGSPSEKPIRNKRYFEDLNRYKESKVYLSLIVKGKESLAMKLVSSKRALNEL
jgi:hypothetical protein